MITEKVYSPVEDKNIKKDLNDSPIWKLCYKEEDITRYILGLHKNMYIYYIKFEGVTPVQVTKVTEMSIKEREKYYR